MSKESDRSVPKEEIKHISIKNKLKLSGKEYYQEKLLSETDESKVYEFKSEDGERKAVKVEWCKDKDELKNYQKAAGFYRAINGYCELVSEDHKDGSGAIYTITDYVDGETLESRLLDKEFATPTELLQLLKKLIRAVCWLNLDRKVLHGELTPSNVMINSKGEIIFIDFMYSGINSDNSTSLKWISTEFMPLIIRLPILPRAIQRSLANIQEMIKLNKTAYPAEIFFDLIIEEIDFLMAMIPLIQHLSLNLDEKNFASIKHEFEEEKILPRAALFAIRARFKKEIIAGLLEEKLDLTSRDFLGETLCEVVASSTPEIVALILERLQKENNEKALLKVFQEENLSLDSLKNFEYFFPEEFKKYITQIKYEAESLYDIGMPRDDTALIKFLVEQGARVPVFVFAEMKQQVWDSFLLHGRMAHMPSSLQFLADIIKYFPKLYVDVLSEFSKQCLQESKLESTDTEDKCLTLKIKSLSKLKAEDIFIDSMLALVRKRQDPVQRCQWNNLLQLQWMLFHFFFVSEIDIGFVINEWGSQKNFSDFLEAMKKTMPKSVVWVVIQSVMVIFNARTAFGLGEHIDEQVSHISRQWLLGVLPNGFRKPTTLKKPFSSSEADSSLTMARDPGAPMMAFSRYTVYESGMLNRGTKRKMPDQQSPSPR